MSFGVGGCALLLLAGGCESTQTKSARIAREGAAAIAPGAAFAVGKASPELHIKRSAVLTDENGSTVAVEIENSGTRAQANVPVLFTVKGKDGKRQFINNLAGLQPSLQHLALARPGTSWWVNDQLIGADHPARTKAKVGTGRPVAGDPSISVSDTDFHDDPDGVYYEGTLTNHTGKDLTEVPVFGVGLKGGQIVAAGRALVPRLPAKPSPGRPSRFRIFFTGDPAGTQVEVTAAPTVLATPEPPSSTS